MNAFGLIIGMLIAAIGLILIVNTVLHPGDGLLFKTVQKALNIFRFDFATPEPLKAQKPTLSSTHAAELQELKKTITLMQQSKNKNCFASYAGFSALGEKGTSITLAYQNGVTQFQVFGGAGGVQRLPEYDFELPIVPCVIAGSSQMMHNFGQSFLNDKKWNEKQIIADHFYPVNELMLRYKSCSVLQSANHIEVPELGLGMSSNVCNNLEDGGLLYTPDNKHICFMPTVYGNVQCDASSSDGTDNDCFIDLSEDIAIPTQLQQGGLLQC